MSNIIPLTIDEARNRVSPYYHLVLQVIAEEYIMPNEKILFASDTTRHFIWDQQTPSLFKAITGSYDINNHKDVVGNSATLLIVTNQRWIRWSLGFYEVGYAVQIEKSGNLIFEWHVPPEKFPHQWLAELLVKQKKTAREYITSNVNVAHLSDLAVVRRSEFTFTNAYTTPETQTHILRLLFNTDIYYSLKYDDGVYLHKLLQLASLNEGKILFEEEVDDDFQKLKKLKLMFENGLITEIEYQEKKAQLLSNM